MTRAREDAAKDPSDDAMRVLLQLSSRETTLAARVERDTTELAEVQALKVGLVKMFQLPSGLVTDLTADGNGPLRPDNWRLPNASTTVTADGTYVAPKSTNGAAAHTTATQPGAPDTASLRSQQSPSLKDLILKEMRREPRLWTTDELAAACCATPEDEQGRQKRKQVQARLSRLVRDDAVVRVADGIYRLKTASDALR